MGNEIPTLPGVLLDDTQDAKLLLELRHTVQQLTGTINQDFPGSQPVSFTRHESIPALLENDYYVCEKSDGVRVLILIGTVSPSGATSAAAEPTPDAVYFITRKNMYHQVSTAPSQPDTWTLVDAELVVDVEDDGQRVQRLLAFDALVVDSICCMTHPLPKRLGKLEQNVVRKLNAKREKYLRQSPELCMPFELQMKHFELSYGAVRVMNEVVPHLKHASDGLIFTSVNAPYVAGTCSEVIKWKPANENSVDMLAHVVDQGAGRPPMVQLYVWEGGNRYVFYGFLALTQKEWDEVIWPARGDRDSINGCVLEVLYDPDYCPPAEWRFMRVRSDKTNANHLTVVSRVRTSIDDGLSFKELETTMTEIRINWKRRAEAINEARAQKQSADSAPAENNTI
ncbi:Dcp1p-Dcp2p decapping enzyme complex alpha subunit [Coemansia sp. RSA 2607]|nr:Dcp1p-Dcp2p decapping enzyme complex alpha subunit [Coemansia sp. RSA 2607]